MLIPPKKNGFFLVFRAWLRSGMDFGALGAQSVQTTDHVIGVHRPARVKRHQTWLLKHVIVAKHRFGFVLRLDQDLGDRSPLPIVDLAQNLRQNFRRKLRSLEDPDDRYLFGNITF